LVFNRHMRAGRIVRAVAFIGVLGSAFLAVMGISHLNAHRLIARADSAATRQAVFRQAWQIVNDKYYDRGMNGLDWQAVRSAYELRLRDANSSFELYWKVLMPMVALLESSHVGVTPPAQHRATALDQRASLEAPESDLESCAGLLISDGRRGVSSRIATVDPKSILFASGVRAGWRLLELSDNTSGPQSGIIAKFVSASGEIVDVPIPAADAHGHTDFSLLKRDVEEFKRVLLRGVSPAVELQLTSLGVVVRVGRLGTFPKVVDVTNGSDAERSGIEPDSEITELKVKPLSAGVRRFEAQFHSPNGNSYGASFDYRCDSKSRGSAPLANRMPGNVLYLRFDVFNAGVAEWLGDQLSRVKPKAVILDFRHNIGGQVTVLQDVMGHFLAAGTKLGVTSDAKHSDYWVASSSPDVFQGPVAVLVGPVSASAAEVGASAFKYYKRGELYGQDTLGKVLLSNIFPLEDGGSIQVATADVRASDGMRLENIGVSVDHTVVPTLAAIRAGRDVVVDSALADLERF
jgi:hypothetical protein